MLALAIGLKIVLLLSILVGAGLVFARASLGDLGDLEARQAVAVLRLQRGCLALAAICAVATFTLIVYRLGGGFDPGIAAFVAQSPPGFAAGLLVSGALLSVFGGKVAVPGALLIVAAFAVTGHASAQSTATAIVAGAHVSAGAWWTGGLLLLAGAAGDHAAPRTSDLLQRFSTQAVPIVAVLLVAGGWVAIELVGLSFSALSTDYGSTLLLKIGLAVGALSVAIYNRLKLVPAIRRGEAAAMNRLRRNALVELAFIGLLATVTGVLTSNMSPPAAMH